MPSDRGMMMSAKGWPTYLTRTSILLFLMLAAIGACQSGCDDRILGWMGLEHFATESEAAATVNGVRLGMSDLDRLHEGAIKRLKATGRPLSPKLDRELRASILRKMIDDEIIRQRVEAQGIVIDRFERVAALERYKVKMGGPKGYDLFLKHQNLTEDQILKTLISDLQRDKLIDGLGVNEPPTEKDIISHYEANRELYSLPEMVRARHILLKVAQGDPPEKIELIEKKAGQILKEASDAVTPFESLVHKYSEGPSVKNGGDLGFFSRGRMVKPFEDLAFSAPLKTAVGPVRTDFGFHIIYVEERSSPRVQSLSDVRDRVIEFVNRNNRARKSEELLYSLRKQAKVIIHDHSMAQGEFGMSPKAADHKDVDPISGQKMKTALTEF